MPKPTAKTKSRRQVTFRLNDDEMRTIRAIAQGYGLGSDTAAVRYAIQRTSLDAVVQPHLVGSKARPDPDPRSFPAAPLRTRVVKTKRRVKI